VRRAWVAAACVLAGCAPRSGYAPAEAADTLAFRRTVWEAILPLSRARDIDPGFVYAIVKLESNFDPHARRGEARGLMQIKPRAWKDVSDAPYEPTVWNWRANLAVGIDSPAGIKRTLGERHAFSYPLLWASYHYGTDFVAAHGFDISRIPRPSDPISYRLFSGEVHPFSPPR
jgi:hypothetical protein